MYNSSIGINLYFMIDVSGSMYGDKIQQVNTFVQDIIPVVQDYADENRLDCYVRVLSFGEGFSWHIGNAENGKWLNSFTWKNLNATARRTDTAKAVNELIRSINHQKSRGEQGNIIILITDGKSTENENLYFDACSALQASLSPNDLKLAVALDGSDRHELETFTKDAQNIFSLTDINNMKMAMPIMSCFEKYGAVSAQIAAAPAAKANNTPSSDDWI